jgi:ribonuclease P protein component
MRDARAQPIGRLTKRPEFLAAASGRRFHTERMSLQGRLRDEADGIAGLRFGFTVTKRVGHATERNRIKRRLRAAARDAGSPHAGKAVDVVVIGRRDALSADYSLLVADLDRGLAVITKPKAARPGKARSHHSSSHSTGDLGREPPYA